ncbi:MAG: AAA family ATPase [Polymorphobacter sp.]
MSLEPKRLFKRYVIGNPLFLLRSAILAAWPKAPVRGPGKLRERRPPAGPFGIGGPAAAFVPQAPPLAMVPVVEAPPVPAAPSLAPIPLPMKPASAAGVSAFSANRPVVGRDQLYGRQAELDRLLGWVLDQNGNALVYGPRGYGKTSLVRVFGEIADSRQHVVLYASGSRNIDFGTLIRSYLAEIADNGLLPPVEPDAVLTVQTVATRLAGITGGSVVLIIDEFDRIEREDTRHALIELVKDISDLTASVRFVLVGVATDVDSVLGYHPSIHRCVSSIGLTRLPSSAIEALFVRKAAIDGLSVAPMLIDTIVKLAAGSAYHAQLIGQKLVAQARRDACMIISRDALDKVVDEILLEAAAMDSGFAHNARAMKHPLTRARLLSLADMALTGSDDLVALETEVDGDAFRPFCDDLVADGVLYAGASANAAHGYRFTNAFVPQLVLMIQYRSLGLAAAAE